MRTALCRRPCLTAATGWLVVSTAVHRLGPQVASSVLKNKVTGLCDRTSFPPKMASISKATHGTFYVAACSLDPFRLSGRLARQRSQLREL